MLPIWDPLVIFTSSFSQLVNYDSLRREIISTSNCQLPKYVAFPLPLVFILPLYLINATTSAFGMTVVFFKELPLTISRKTRLSSPCFAQGMLFPRHPYSCHCGKESKKRSDRHGSSPTPPDSGSGCVARARLGEGSLVGTVRPFTQQSLHMFVDFQDVLNHQG